MLETFQGYQNYFLPPKFVKLIEKSVLKIIFFYVLMKCKQALENRKRFGFEHCSKA